MDKSRWNERWAGVFYIIATLAPILAVAFVGFLGGGAAGEPIPDYLAQVASDEGAVIIGMFIEVIWALAVLLIPIALFSLLKKHGESLALGFLGLRFIESMSVIVRSIFLLSLLTLGREFAAAGAAEVSLFQSIGSVLVTTREWTFLIGCGLVWSLSALVLNYLLYRSSLIPRWLSVWGLLGSGLSLATYAVQFYGINMTEWLFFPIAAQEMVFAVWLIVKGLRPSVASQSTK